MVMRLRKECSECGSHEQFRAYPRLASTCKRACQIARACACTMYHVHVPCIMYHVSCVMYHVPRIMYHIPRTMCHVPRVMYHVARYLSYAHSQSTATCARRSLRQTRRWPTSCPEMKSTSVVCLVNWLSTLICMREGKRGVRWGRVGWERVWGTCDCGAGGAERGGMGWGGVGSGLLVWGAVAMLMDTVRSDAVVLWSCRGAVELPWCCGIALWNCAVGLRYPAKALCDWWHGRYRCAHSLKHHLVDHDKLVKVEEGGDETELVGGESQ